MHLHIIDHYQKLKSPLHQMDGRIKLVFIVFFIICCTLLPAGAWPAYILFFCILTISILISDLAFSYVMKRSILALPFLLAAAPLIFRHSDEPLLYLSIGKHLMSISSEGFILFLSLGIKSWLSVISAILLASTTSFTELLISMRMLGVPRLLVAVFSLMWRYLFIMFEEVNRLIRARIARSGRDKKSQRWHGASLPWRAKVAGGMAGSLFVRSLERSERIYYAMLSRGYDGEIRYLEVPPVKKISILWLCLVIVFMFLMVIASRMLTGA